MLLVCGCVHDNYQDLCILVQLTTEIGTTVEKHIHLYKTIMYEYKQQVTACMD